MADPANYSQPYSFKQRKKLRSQARERAEGMKPKQIASRVSKLREQLGATDVDQARLRTRISGLRSPIQRKQLGPPSKRDWRPEGYEGFKNLYQLKQRVGRLEGKENPNQERLTKLQGQLSEQSDLAKKNRQRRNRRLQKSLSEKRYSRLYGGE